MTSISRRIRRLEDRLGPPVETASLRRLRERLDAARRRIAKAEGREYGDSAPNTMRRESENLSSLTVTQILHRGRARARARSQDIQRLARDGNVMTKYVTLRRNSGFHTDQQDQIEEPVSAPTA